MTSTTLTNVSLVILATVSLLEFLAIVAVGICAYRMYHQLTAVVTSLERDHIAPLHMRVDMLLDEVERVTGGMKRAGNLLAGKVKVTSWPVVGILRGLRTAVDTLTANGLG
jgi:hypothetical protein